MKGKLRNFGIRFIWGKGEEINLGLNSVLYLVPYFPYSHYEHLAVNKRNNTTLPFIHIDYDDQEFKAELRRMIKPLYALSKPDIPKNCTTVALHMRRGLAFDGPEHCIKVPWKEPPMSYYLTQIRSLYNFYGNQPMYVHLFTDHLHPQEILKKLRLNFQIH